MKLQLIILVIVFVGVLIFWGCVESKKNSDYTIGTIKKIELSGGFYGIITEDGKKLNPINLDNKFKEDGLKIKFNYEKADVMTSQMWGTPVEIFDVEIIK